MSYRTKVFAILSALSLMLAACASIDPPTPTGAPGPTEAPESTEAPDSTEADDEASNDTFLIVLLIAGVLAIALLIGGSVARNRNKPPEEG